MKILVINAGSSSVKIKLFIHTKTKLEEQCKIHVDGINTANCEIGIFSSQSIHEKKRLNSVKESIEYAIKKLVETNQIKDLNEIERIGHRVVHGGEKFRIPTIITKKVLTVIRDLSKLAPLHNPANTEGILTCKKLFPKAKQIACFDTSFFTSLEKKAFLYGLPYEFYQKHKIRRYGFHGLSHSYVTKKTKELLKKPAPKIITCHLGNGSSITASKNCRALETSMGFTPMEGLPMGTRSGTIDPGIIFHLNENLKIDIKEIKNILNQKSGLLGLSKISSDMRKIFLSSQKNNQNAILTIEILSYQIAKYLGQYIIALGGVDAITFTGGMGEKAYYIREKAISHLNFLGIKLNKNLNKKNHQTISSKASKTKIYVIPTDEEKEIALNLF